MIDLPSTKLLVFIPTFNCVDQVKRVIDQFDISIQSLVDTVMVVDNHSSDGTLQAAIDEGKKKFSACKFIVWLNARNYGLGGSHKIAFRYAIQNGFHYLIVLHGDDQADIRDLRSILCDEVYSQYDCHLGSRFMQGSRLNGYSLLRTLGNRLYNKIFSIAALEKIHDLGSGLNIYRLSSFKEFYYKKFPDDLTFNYVMLLASYYKKQHIGFFPISWREEDQRSNVKILSQAVKVIALLLTFIRKRNNFLSREFRRISTEEYSGDIIYKNEYGV